MPQRFCFQLEGCWQGEKWAARNIMLFNEEKCKVLPLERNKISHQGMLGAIQLEISYQKMEFQVDTKVNMSEQCAFAE